MLDRSQDRELAFQGAGHAVHRFLLIFGQHQLSGTVRIGVTLSMANFLAMVASPRVRSVRVCLGQRTGKISTYSARNRSMPQATPNSAVHSSRLGARGALCQRI